MAEVAASRLSQRAFCKQRGIAEPLFYHWRRVLAEEDARLAQQSSGLPARTSVEGKGEVRFALVARYGSASQQAGYAHAAETGDDVVLAGDNAGQERDATDESGYPQSGRIELLLDRGWRLRIGRGAEETTLRTVLAALAAMSPAQ
ncbi:MAG: hypothetical protein MUF01_08020 [Bryobacterales bacterium]|jgi:hypothetical protein|nr:hypothetical protein [Bryobacterales bacterium]